MNVALPVVSFVVGILGVVLGAWMTRRNEKKATAERLLIEAVNDALKAIASNAHVGGAETKAAYASAVSRIGFHGSPAVVSAFGRFQDDATTVTADGRRRLLAAVILTRAELGQTAADESDLSILMFGAEPLPETESSGRPPELPE
jgi:hypothetical protein